MKVDRHGRLFVVSGSSARVFVYDAGSGALVRRFSTRYEKKQFLNDIAIAPNGDAFVTDSFRPMLYRIRARAVRPTGGTARLDPGLDLRGTAISYVRGDVNLNGIALRRSPPASSALHPTTRAGSTSPTWSPRPRTRM